MLKNRIPLSMLLVALIGLTGCGRQDVLSLAAGDCFQDPDDEATEVSSVSSVDCSEPHDNEVFAVVNVTDEALPPDIAQRADQECSGTRFTEFVGVEYLDSDFSYATLYPSMRTWLDGDRAIVCALYRDDLQPMTGTQRGAGLAAATPTEPSAALASPAPAPAGTAPAPAATAPAPAATAPAPAATAAGPAAPAPPPGGAPLSLPPAGSCFAGFSEDLAGLASVAVTACTNAHDYEVVGIAAFDDAPGAPYPGTDALDDLAVELCTPLFESYVGTGYFDSEYVIFPFVPDVTEWGTGARQVVCGAGEVGQMTTSIQGTGE